MHVKVVPGKVALHAVVDVARASEQVVLPGINYQFRGNVQGSQRLIHLFAASNGHIEVSLAAHEQRRRVNAICVKKGIGNFDPGVE